MGKSFGNIRDISLAEVREMKEFRKLWDLSKSNIDLIWKIFKLDWILIYHYWPEKRKL